MRDNRKKDQPRLVAGTRVLHASPCVRDWVDYGSEDFMYEAEARKYARYAVLRGKGALPVSIVEVIGEQRARRLIAEALDELCGFETSGEGFVGYGA